MKILFIAPRFHTNQYFVVKKLKQEGHEVRFFVLHKLAGAEKHDILEPTLIKNLFSLGYFRKLKTFNPDVVIVRNPNEPFSFITLVACRLLKIKNIIIYTQGPLYRKKTLKTNINKIFLNIFGAKWITPVPGEKNKYEKFDERAYYLPFAIEPILTSFEEKQFFAGGKVNIITIGKLNLPRKNIILLLKAFKELKEEFPVRLTIVGYLENEEGEHYQKTLDFIEKNNLSGIVDIKKNLDLFGVHKEYLIHDLFVLSSSNEPAAYSPVEAMSAGLPVISSDTNGTKHYIKEGENGYIFKSDDLEDLMEKVCNIIQDKSKLISMGKTSFEFALKKYNTEKYYKKLVDTINI